MKKKLFSKTDYSYSSLPATRKEAFKDVYRQNFMTIFKCGAFLLIGFLPLMAFMVIMEINKTVLTLDSYSEHDLFGVLFVWDLIMHLGFVLFFVIVLLFLSGILRIIKLLVFQEGIDFFYDFKRGIKENFKQFFLFYLIYASLYLLTYLLQLFFLNQVIGVVSLAIFHLVFTPPFIWGLHSINIYDAPLHVHIKNAFFFYTKSFGLSLLYTVMTILIMAISFLFYENIFAIGVNIIFILAKNILIVFALLFYFPSLLIISSLFSNSKFDLYINKDRYPEIYQKGLYK